MDELGIRRASVIGHSYGGYLAMRLARQHPGRTDKVVLISPALDVEVAPPAFARSRLLRSMAYPALRVLVSSPRGLRKLLEQAYHREEALTTETVRQYQQRLLVEGLDRAYRGFGASIGKLPEERVKLADLEAPVLVVAGREDQVVPLDGLQGAMQAAPSNVGLRIIEDSGHSVPEEQAERLARELLAFLDGK
jgi:pimeloyl-ACP methyl ester carboxylesterase